LRMDGRRVSRLVDAIYLEASGMFLGVVCLYLFGVGGVVVSCFVLQGVEISL